MAKNYNIHLRGTVGYWNFSSEQVEYILDRNKDGEVKVLINSLGGSLAEGLAISSLFKVHGNVAVHYIGMNASAATIASMGAKRVTIDAHALYLVHKISQPVIAFDYFNADELARHIAEMEKKQAELVKMDGVVAGLYAARCRKPKADLLALMSKDTWLTAKEALEWGFVDEVTDDPDDTAPQIDDTTAAAMTAAGIPLPPVGIKKDTVFTRMLQGMAALFNHTNNPGDAEEADPTNPQPTPPMPKTEFSRLAALLGVSVALAADETLALTHDQCQQLDDHLAKLAADIEEAQGQLATKQEEAAHLTAQVAELNKKVADLENEPAATTTTVVEPVANGNQAQPETDLRQISEALLDFLK